MIRAATKSSNPYAGKAPVKEPLIVPKKFNYNH